MVIPARAFPKLLPFPPGWALRRKTTVVPRDGKPGSILLLEIGRDTLLPAIETTLLLRHTDGTITKDYHELTADFYLSLV